MIRKAREWLTAVRRPFFDIHAEMLGNDIRNLQALWGVPFFDPILRGSSKSSQNSDPGTPSARRDSSSSTIHGRRVYPTTLEILQEKMAR